MLNLFNTTERVKEAFKSIDNEKKVVDDLIENFAERSESKDQELLNFTSKLSESLLNQLFDKNAFIALLVSSNEIFGGSVKEFFERVSKPNNKVILQKLASDHHNISLTQ